MVVISTVDSAFYEGAFKMDEAARKAGFTAPGIYTFDPKDDPGYTHRNTANKESAADGHTAFASFDFSDAWPDGLTYLENYVKEDEAERLVREIEAAPWRTDLKRRVQHYGCRYDYKARTARREDHLGPLPDLFQHLAERLTSEGHFQAVPEQVIIDGFQPGQGISAHIDCQPCFGETIATLSLLSGRVLQFAA